MNPLIVGALIRGLLQVGSGILVAQGVITAEEADTATNAVSAVISDPASIVGAVTFFATLGWSIWQKSQPKE
jgi:hypothetical protein